MDGSENFNRSWDDYVSGFGSVWGEQWLGLEKIHCLTTTTARTEMKIDMADFRGDKKYATTTSLWSGMLLVSTSYRLRATAVLPETVYSVAVEDTTPMEWHFPHMTETMTCGVTVTAQAWEGGGWWFNNCMASRLNGIYQHDITQRSWEVVYWDTFTTPHRSLKFAEMKLRARD